MTLRPVRIALAASLLIASGCVSVRVRPGGSTESAVRAAMASFLDALNALDINRINASFTDDVTAFVPSVQGQQAVGRAAVSQIFRDFVDRLKATRPRLSLVPEDERVDASSTLGVVTFQIRDTAPVIVRRRTFVFRLVGDRWLISHFHASDLVPPPK